MCATCLGTGTTAYGGTGTYTSGTGGTTGTGTGGTIDTTVPVSDAAGISTPYSTDTGDGTDFGSPADFLKPDEASLASYVSNYTEAISNIGSSYSSVVDSYNFSKNILESGLDSSRLTLPSGGCSNPSISFMGSQIPIDMSWFARLYPLFYAFIFIALHILGIKIYISGAKFGNGGS